MPGWEELALAITGQPAPTAAAKSPPETLLKARGKLFGPKTATPPSRARYMERMPLPVSMVGRLQERARAEAAAWRSWPVVRGSSISASRGAAGRPVSASAMATISPERASMRPAKASRKAAAPAG